MLPIILSLTRHQRLFLSAAFLGDIALDEEDLQMFKVDRIIDWAQRTIKIINHTESGKNVRSNKFKISPKLLLVFKRLCYFLVFLKAAFKKQL